jgi:hypothetical protein
LTQQLNEDLIKIDRKHLSRYECKIEGNNKEIKFEKKEIAYEYK